MYNTFGSARYVLTEENKAIRDIAGSAPYDFITILVNDSRYGGGGIFNLYTTCFTKPVKAGQEWEMDYVYVHEFGHCFGGLGDEYYSSQVSYVDFYPKGVEPWEPNVTRTNTRENLKWRSLISTNTPIPTPWHKTKYDSIETVQGKIDRFASDYYEKRAGMLISANDILKDSSCIGIVGAFEGSGYTSKDMYRPAIDCKMFSLNPVDFDPVCAAAIERMIRNVRQVNKEGETILKTNPIALITGASSGIGLELAKLFARDSHDLALVARSYDKLKFIAEDLQKTYGVQVKSLHKRFICFFNAGRNF